MDADKIKKLIVGEAVGYVCAAVCAAALVFFIAGFTAAQTLDIAALRYASLIGAPVILVVFAGVSALCNLKFTAALDREISLFVRGKLIENAACMHPERESLTFTVAFGGRTAYLKVNGYKEKIEFDFSALGRIGAYRRASLVSAITSQLGSAFCRLAERGARYKLVECVADGKKPVKIIEGGVPDKKIYKEYLKNR